MRDIQKERIAAFFLSAIITIAIIGSMIIIHEESSEFKELLVNLTGHHWLTKSILAIILFPLLSIGLYFMFGSEKLRKALRADDLLFWALLTIVTSVIFMLGSLLVYLLHYFS